MRHCVGRQSQTGVGVAILSAVSVEILALIYALLLGIIGARWYASRHFRSFVPRILGVFIGFLVGAVSVAGLLLLVSAAQPALQTAAGSLLGQEIVAALVGLLVVIASLVLVRVVGRLLLVALALPPTAVPKRPQKQYAKRSIFIPYRRADSGDVSGRIYDRLQQHFGRTTVFRDIESIPPGLDFPTVLQRTLQRCTVVLVLIGPGWIEARDKSGQMRLDDPEDFVRREIEQALTHVPVIIPVLVNHATLPDPAKLPASLQKLAYRNAVAVRPDPDFHHDMDRLIRSIDQALQAVK